MSWNSGNRVWNAIMASLVDRVPDYQTRVDIYCDLIPAFEEMDCDTLDECVGFDDAFDNTIYVNTFVNEFIAHTGVSETVACAQAELAFTNLSGDPYEDANTMAARYKT